MAFLSPWGGVGGPSLLFRSFLLPCTTSRALAGPGRPQPRPSPATRMKPQPCLVCWGGELLGWGGRRTGRQGGGQGQTGRSGKLCRKKGDMPVFRLEKSHWLSPTSSAPVPLSQSLWAAHGRERRGAGLERNSPAAQECQASRSPDALRLMAPVRSQEQPSARSPGAETPPGRPPPSLLLCRLPETCLVTSFLQQTALLPHSLPSPTGCPHSASCQQPMPTLPRATPRAAPSLSSPTTTSLPGTQSHCHLAWFSRA